MPANYKLVAIQIGDILKYQKSISEIDRAAQSVCSFTCRDFSSKRGSITSERAFRYLCWVYTIGVQTDLPLHKRNQLIVQFTYLLINELERPHVNSIFERAGVLESSDEFDNRKFHKSIIKNSRRLFIETNYFHAVFEAAKLYNKQVQNKSGSTKDGYHLMMDVFGEKGILKHNNGITTTEKDELNGIKFLSAGLMQALRNPTAHELASEWSMSKEDCLDILSFISFLLRKLDISH